MTDTPSKCNVAPTPDNTSEAKDLTAPERVGRYSIDGDFSGASWMTKDPDGNYVLHSDYVALSAKLEAAEAERDAALGVLQEMRDDKTGFRDTVHFRRRAAAFLAALDKDK